MAQVPPAVTLSEAQAYVRIETGEEEAVVVALVASTTALCEQFTGRWLVERDFDLMMPAAAEWRRLAVTPVRSIAGASSVALDGSAAVLAASDYAIDIDADGDGWVRLNRLVGSSSLGAGRVRVTGRAGMATGESDVPEPLRQGILRLVAHLFTARDGGGGEPPSAVTALWRPYRRMRMA